MMMPIENILLWVAVLMLVSVVSSKLSDKFAIPALLLFLAIGMLAGSGGIGGILALTPIGRKRGLSSGLV